MLATAASIAFVLLNSQASINAFDEKIAVLLKLRNTAGCAIVFSEKGKVVFAKGYGFANLEHQVRMRPEHVHELASVSKQFTAVAILQLAESGALDLEDPILKYFPSAGKPWDKVRIRHLLNHTGGLPDYLSAIGDVAKRVNPTLLVDAIKDKPLVFEPGTKFAYSNSGYMILGLIVELASKLRTSEYLAKRLFEPAGMKTAVLNSTSAVIPNRADGYSNGGQSAVREGYTSDSLSATGDGHIMASALDLAAWDAALYGDKLISTRSKELLFTKPGIDKSAEVNGYYGFGVNVRIDGGLRVQHHGGGWMGTSTYLARYVDQGKCLIVLCNSNGAQIQELVKACEERFLIKS